MDLTLTKTEEFKLEPFGKFTLKFVNKARSVRTIPVRELSQFHETKMPFTEEQEKEIIKFMKKNKTDILSDGSYFGFYTRVGGGEFGSLCRVEHPSLIKYREDDTFKALVDN